MTIFLEAAEAIILGDDPITDEILEKLEAMSEGAKGEDVISWASLLEAASMENMYFNAENDSQPLDV